MKTLTTVALGAILVVAYSYLPAEAVCPGPFYPEGGGEWAERYLAQVCKEIGQ